jgi:prephenate dehydratase
MDFEGHIDDVKISRAIDHLADVTSFVKVLGSYRMHENSL